MSVQEVPTTGYRGTWDFDANDKKTTYVLLLICTNSEMVHLRVLAKLNRLFRDPEILVNLLKARDGEEIMGVFIKADPPLGYDSAGRAETNTRSE